MKALEIVTAMRLPKMSERTGTGVFDALGDVTVSCGHVDEVTGRRCGWNAMGPRAQMKGAVVEHRRMFHSQATRPWVTLLNQPWGLL